MPVFNEKFNFGRNVPKKHYNKRQEDSLTDYIHLKDAHGPDIDDDDREFDALERRVARGKYIKMDPSS